MAALQKELHLNEPPHHIECFDNSNLQGTNPVASCVVFRDGKPSRKEYRHFNIKTVVGANDFASMEEVVTRRYSRLLEEGAELPQLIVVDGGKGQLRFAYETLKRLGLEQKIAIVGLAKRIEEVYFPHDPIRRSRGSIFPGWIWGQRPPRRRHTVSGFPGTRGLRPAPRQGAGQPHGTSGT